MPSISGLDRLVSAFPSLEAAAAARPPAPVLALVAGTAAAVGGGHAQPRRRQATEQLRPAEAHGNGAAITPAAARSLVNALLDNALLDGVALADRDGTITLANARLEEMFGYQYGELIGHTVESLIPAHLHEGRRCYRASYTQALRARTMGAEPRLVGLRRDGTTFPAEISLSPLGQFTLAVIRDVTKARRLEELADLAAVAVAAMRPAARGSCSTRSSPACSASA